MRNPALYLSLTLRPCSSDTAWCLQPNGVTTSSSIQAFSGNDPRCLNCSVANCLRCADAVDNCAVCGYGHDLSADNATCVERALTTVMFGGTATGYSVFLA